MVIHDKESSELMSAVVQNACAALVAAVPDDRDVTKAAVAAGLSAVMPADLKLAGTATVNTSLEQTIWRLSSCITTAYGKLGQKDKVAGIEMQLADALILGVVASVAEACVPVALRAEGVKSRDGDVVHRVTKGMVVSVVRSLKIAHLLPAVTT